MIMQGSAYVVIRAGEPNGLLLQRCWKARTTTHGPGPVRRAPFTVASQVSAGVRRVERAVCESAGSACTGSNPVPDIREWDGPPSAEAQMGGHLLSNTGSSSGRRHVSHRFLCGPGFVDHSRTRTPDVAGDDAGIGSTQGNGGAAEFTPVLGQPRLSVRKLAPS